MIDTVSGWSGQLEWGLRGDQGPSTQRTHTQMRTEEQTLFPSASRKGISKKGQRIASTHSSMRKSIPTQEGTERIPTQHSHLSREGIRSSPWCPTFAFGSGGYQIQAQVPSPSQHSELGGDPFHATDPQNKNKGSADVDRPLTRARNGSPPDIHIRVAWAT